MLVIGVHVPVLERLLAGPEADLVVPAGILSMDPPCEMQETGQTLQMLAHIGEDVFEFFVAAAAGKAHPLHTQIDGHPDSSSMKFARMLAAIALDDRPTRPFPSHGPCRVACRRIGAPQ